jgi:hypothetical protein
MLIAAYLINRLPSANQNFKSPLEILYDRKINIDHLRVFGCVCFIHKNKIDKLDFTSTKEIFLGYSIFKKGYKCYDLKTKKLFISRDVTFLEKDSFYKNIEKDQNNHLLLSEFVLSSYTNQERREVLVENHTQIGTQETEDNEQSQVEEEEGDSSEEIQEEEIPLRRSNR